MLRPAAETDAERIRTWRNHPRVRRAHFVSRPITPEEHAGWWASVRSGERRALIYERSGPIGVVHFGRFDATERSAHWGFFLDLRTLEPRGDLIAAWIELEREAIEYAFGPLGLAVLRGETLVDNEPVRALHRRFGFTEVSTFTREIDGVRHHAVLTELARSSARTRRLAPGRRGPCFAPSWSRSDSPSTASIA